jgi:hypothetical protein
MFKPRSYDSAGDRFNFAMVAAFIWILVLSATLGYAQVAPSVTSHGMGGTPVPRGIPPSVTSIGFGPQGNRTRGLPPSVTSLGFPNTPGTITRPQFPRREHSRRGDHPFGGVVYGVPYYPYSYYDDNSEAPADDASPASDYRGGPTIFDRRGPGMNRSTQEGDSDDSHTPKAETRSEPQPVSNQPDTLLVFKDGHQLEIANYAIVGSTLFDLTDGHRRKIPLSELDLTATAKQNDDRGIDFQVPLGTEAN